MENYHSAFLPGEHARLQTQSLLAELQLMHLDQGGLHAKVPPEMTEYAGKQVLIVSRSYSFSGWVFYELHGLPGVWPEAALIDHKMLEGELPINQPANLTYVALRSGDGDFVDICTHDGRRFCSFRRRDAAASADDINRVAKLRTRASFSYRYEFDGVEYDEHPEHQK